jgi:hypothetical protein
MSSKILEMIKTDHELYKQWSYGLTDPKLVPVVSRIDVPKGNQKKVIMVLPSFLMAFGLITNKKSALILILKDRRIITLYYCDHPNYLFRKEKNADFQIIY